MFMKYNKINQINLYKDLRNYTNNCFQSLPIVESLHPNSKFFLQASPRNSTTKSFSKLDYWYPIGGLMNAQE